MNLIRVNTKGAKKNELNWLRQQFQKYHLKRKSEYYEFIFELAS